MDYKIYTCEYYALPRDKYLEEISEKLFAGKCSTESCKLPTTSS